MYAPTANGTLVGRNLEQPQITDSKPKVATNSLKTCAAPLRACCDAENICMPNIKCATTLPAIPPQHCATTYVGTSRQGMPRSIASAKVTAGLKWAPDTGPNVKIRATSAAPVAIVFASRAMATFPAASLSAMIPDPITVETSKQVPTN